MSDTRTPQEAFLTVDHTWCSWSKRRLREGEPAAFGRDRKGNWRIVANVHAHVLAEVFTVGGWHYTKNAPLGGQQVSSLEVSAPTGGETPWKADDRKWFAANPTRTHRIRATYEGEHLGAGTRSRGDGSEATLVRQMEPGARLRYGLDCPVGTVPDDDDILSALVDLLTERAPSGGRVYAADIRAVLATRSQAGTA